jgi:hypothetical protein
MDSGRREGGYMDWNMAALITPPTLPMMATIYGGPKTGKSELEGSFLGLVIMAWESPGPTLEGRKDIVMTPLIKTFEDGMGFLRFLYKEPHDFKTLGIDTITRMSKVFETEIIANDPKKPKGMGDAQGGYGKSYGVLSEMHGKIVQACEALRRDRGMNIVFVAHSDVGKFSPPDGETYNVYELDMHEDSASHYLNNSDIIGFLDQKTLTREGDDGKVKVASTDQRILKVKSSAAHVSGNRYGITEDLIVEKGKNPLEQYLRADRASVKRELKEGETL